MKPPKILRVLVVSLIKKTNDQTFLILVGAFIGICGGFASVILHKLVHFTFHSLNELSPSDYVKFFIPCVGLILTVTFTKFISKEKPGHGVPDVMYAIARNFGVIKAKLMFSRLITSTLTVGFGGSAGLEGPIVVTGSAIGSNIGQLLNLNERRKSILIGCGTAAGITGILNAPIAGVIFALEVILGEFGTAAFIPIVISAVCATEVGRIFLGDKVQFTPTPFNSTIYELGLFILLGIVCGFVSVFFSKVIYFVEDQFKTMKIHVLAKAGIGGILLGIVSLVSPSAMGEGYDLIQSLLQGNVSNLIKTDLGILVTATLGDPLLIVSFILIFKILATTFTLGSGGSGGIFAPSLALGSLVGYVFSHGVNLINNNVISEAQTFITQTPKSFLPILYEPNYSLAGMTGIIAGMLHAPLTSIFLIFEITGSYDAILPLMIVSTISFVVSKFFEPESVYTKHLVEQGNLIRKNTDVGVLTKISITDILETNYNEIEPESTLGELVEIVKISKRNFFPVVDKEQKFCGVVLLAQIRESMFDKTLYDKIIVSEIMDSGIATVDFYERMENVMKKFEATEAWSLPVVRDGKFVGMISKSTIFFKYRNELISQNKS
ncbi:chloride channel protein [bacterium]|nr:chloride channel protein [bacterium]